MMNIKIRRAKIKDVDYIYKLGKETKELRFSKKFKFHDKEEIKEYVKNTKGNILLVALHENKFAGFLFGKIIDKDWCMIDNIAVEKEFRKMGIGSLLLNNFYEILKNKKVSYIQVLEDIHNKKTRKFWKEKGFKEEKVFVWADKVLR